MHAYLVVGRDNETKTETVNKLARKLDAKTLEFPLQKIEDARQLAEFTSLTVGEPTAILINSVDTATTEALNAFLKNLEEPQENLYYILTANTIHGILPTIVSRCEVIQSKQQTVNEAPVNQSAAKFLRKSVGEKLAFIDKIKKREEAIIFLEEFIESGHALLNKEGTNYGKISRALRAGTQTLNALKANGNVALQLTNFVVQAERRTS